MHSFVKEKRKVQLKNPVLISGFPGLGYVGKIAIIYLIKQLKAKKMAELYSPYFPHHVLVSSSGRVRLPCAQFYFWTNPKEKKRDLLLLTGDSQAQGVEGQYNLANQILGYANQKNVQTAITLGGYRGKQEKEPKVVAISPNRTLLDKLIKAGANTSPLGNPIVGIAGLILGLAKFKEIKAACLLGNTIGYMSDPKTAKYVLKVLQQFLGLDVNLSNLDDEIKKTSKIFDKIEEIQTEIENLVKEQADIEGHKITYIS